MRDSLYWNIRGSGPEVKRPPQSMDVVGLEDMVGLLMEVIFKSKAVGYRLDYVLELMEFLRGRAVDPKSSLVPDIKREGMSQAITRSGMHEQKEGGQKIKTGV